MKKSLVAHDAGKSLTQREVDYHCHILPELDDGAASTGESLRIAKVLADTGYHTIHCTPHLIKGMYEATNEDVVHEIKKLQLELKREGIPVRLLAGREYYLDEYCQNYLKQPLLLEGTNFLLVEIPGSSSIELVKNTLFSICCKGYTPLIAHPERCNLLEHPKQEEGEKRWKSWFSAERSKPDTSQSKCNTLLTYLKELGCHFQANLGSLNGQYGKLVQANAERYKKNGIYTHAGTDAHSAEILKTILKLG